MVTGIRGWISLILGAVIVAMTFLPMLGINVLGPLGAYSPYILLAALVFLVIDGFMEDHMLKTVTLIFGLLMALFVAVPLIHGAGWIPFTIPSAVMFLYPWVVGISGALLIVGTFTRDM